MQDFDLILKEYSDRFELVMKNRFESICAKDSLDIIDAMKYAVCGGGKRIRPILLYAACDMLKIDKENADYYALALEFIHSYSLVHDDLPSMDNDDYRRGLLSTHKKFGEAMGILAGDALLNFAFETVLSNDNFSKNDLCAARILSEYAGYSGMIAGQVLDLQSENALGDEDVLYKIYVNKTSKLLTAPLLIASCLSDKLYYDELKKLGFNLGIMFQITDDIMDVEGSFNSIGKTPNKDEKENKLTSIKIWGLQGAKEKNEELFNQCIEILSKIPNSDFLIYLIKKIYLRKK